MYRAIDFLFLVDLELKLDAVLALSFAAVIGFDACLLITLSSPTNAPIQSVLLCN